jgi:hypothetical protein
MVSKDDELKASALTLGGALIAITVALYVEKPPSYAWLPALIVPTIILFLYGMGAFKWLRHWWHTHTRQGIKICLKKPRVGILSDLKWDDFHTTYATYTNISPECWQRAIVRETHQIYPKVKVKLISTKKNFDKFLIILNPYGGAYPERNQQILATLDRIFEYVAAGGIFVNVADIPGFYADRPELGHRLPLGRQDLRDILHTPFMDRLGLYVYAGAYNNLMLTERFKIPPVEPFTGDRAVHTTLEEYPILDPIVEPQEVNIGGRTRTVTQSFLKKYGTGKFLISMLPITKSKNSEMRDVLARIIVQEVQRATSVKKAKRKLPTPTSDH